MTAHTNIGYRDLVTVDGQFVPRAIITLAHRKARREFEAYRNPVLFPYARLFREELIALWSLARAMKVAGKGEARTNATPMFVERRAA